MVGDGPPTSSLAGPPHPGCLRTPPPPCLQDKASDQLITRGVPPTHSSSQRRWRGWSTPALSSWPPARSGGEPGPAAAPPARPGGGGEGAPSNGGAAQWPGCGRRWLTSLVGWVSWATSSPTLRLQRSQLAMSSCRSTFWVLWHSPAAASSLRGGSISCTQRHTGQRLNSPPYSRCTYHPARVGAPMSVYAVVKSSTLGDSCTQRCARGLTLVLSQQAESPRRHVITAQHL